MNKNPWQHYCPYYKAVRWNLPQIRECTGCGKQKTRFPVIDPSLLDKPTGESK